MNHESFFDISGPKIFNFNIMGARRIFFPGVGKLEVWGQTKVPQRGSGTGIKPPWESGAKPREADDRL